MTKTYNFSAGPSSLPQEVLRQAQIELLDFKGSGMSVMEISHRGSWYKDLQAETIELIRQLLQLKLSQQPIFMGGGASLQFTLVPLNLAQGRKCYYLNSGSFAKQAMLAAQKLAKQFSVTAEELATTETIGYVSLPKFDSTTVDPTAAYVHFTSNNTVEGTAWPTLPKVTSVPLVADCSSNIMSVNYPYHDLALFYAGAQKNLGIAGVTLVVIDRSLIDVVSPESDVPGVMLDYRTQIEKDSVYNTPPVFAVYMLNLMAKWVYAQGGVLAMEQQCQAKSGVLYDYLDASTLYFNNVEKSDRSINNVTFTTGNPDLDQQFVKSAAVEGLVSLGGHRSVGGMRASLYNAFPMDGVRALIDFMENFRKDHS